MLKHLISTIFSFKGLYVAFFIAVVFYGQLRLMFGLTPRHIAIVVMLIACIRQGISFPVGRIMKTYLLFILTYLVSATITGYIGKVLISYYIAVFAGIWATKILIVKYKDGKLLLNTIIILGVLNALVTIGQTFGLSISDQIVSALHLKLPEKYLNVLDANEGEGQTLLLTRPGLFKSAVYNGYFLMTAGVISLILFTRKLWIQRFIPWAIITLGCICVQERGPIIILTLLSAFAFYKIPIIKRRKYAFMFLLFFFIVQSIVGSIESLLQVSEMKRTEPLRTYTTYSDDDESESDTWNNYSRFARESRFANVGFEDAARERIYSQTINYLMDHPFIGGSHRLYAMYDIYPHNLFLLAFVYGGVVGGICILLILFWQIKPLWRVFKRRIADTNTVCFFTGMAYVAYTLNSLVHNRSIVTGDEVIWMLWATFYFEYLKYFRRDTRL